MGGPCKNIKTSTAAPDSNVAKYAKKRGLHPRVSQLSGRIATYERCEKSSKTDIHKPGSQNRKK